MLRILLIRHGTTELLGRVLYGRMPNVHLNDEGRAQAQILARELKARYNISEVVSSPLERARETAEPIAAAQQLTVSIDEGVNEINFGSWMGKSFSELMISDDWKRYNQARATSTPPGGESMMEVQARTWSSLQMVAGRYPNQQDVTAAVITHGDVIRALLVLLLGMSPDHIHRLEVAPASVSEISLEPGGPRVQSINRTYA